jgi:hypothetical protein
VCYKHECVSDKLTRADAMIPRRQPAVPKVLIGQIDAALAALDDARAELTRVVASGTTLLCVSSSDLAPAVVADCGPG